MRTVYRLLGLVRRYGAERVEAACCSALDLDVVSVTKIAAMLERATESATRRPLGSGDSPTRFSRDPDEFRTTPTPVTLITATPTTTASTEENL